MNRKNLKSRLIFLATMLIAVAYIASISFGQDAAGGAAADEAVVPQGLVSIILGHVDAITITIVILSIVCFTLIISSTLRLRKSVFMPDETINTIRGMIEQRQFKELIEYTETDTSFVGKAINPALKRAPSFSAMKEAMETSLGEQTAEQFRKIEYLNIIGNLGPLLGLLGTVLGMIEAFSNMQAQKGSADPAGLAGGIAKALAHTFMGLFLAVPALAAFGIIRTVVDRLTVRGALVAEELLLMIKPEGNKTPTPAAPGVKPPVVPGAPVAPRKVAAPVPQPPVQA